MEPLLHDRIGRQCHVALSILYAFELGVVHHNAPCTLIYAKRTLIMHADLPRSVQNQSTHTVAPIRNS